MVMVMDFPMDSLMVMPMEKLMVKQMGWPKVIYWERRKHSEIKTDLRLDLQRANPKDSLMGTATDLHSAMLTQTVTDWVKQMGFQTATQRGLVKARRKAIRWHWVKEKEMRLVMPRGLKRRMG